VSEQPEPSRQLLSRHRFVRPGGHQEQEQSALSLISCLRAFGFPPVHNGRASRVIDPPFPSPTALRKPHIEHQNLGLIQIKQGSNHPGLTPRVEPLYFWLRPTMEPKTDGVGHDSFCTRFKPGASSAGRYRNSQAAWTLNRCRIAGVVGIDDLRLGLEPRIFLSLKRRAPAALASSNCPNSRGSRHTKGCPTMIDENESGGH
jgi:hypothetical protein